MAEPTAVEIRPFNSASWIAGSLAYGFAAGASFAVLVWIALAIALAPTLHTWLRYEFALMADVALLSLPAIGQRRLLRRCGIDSRGYVTATLLGGWVAWNLPVLAFGCLERIERLHRFEEIDLGIAVVALALLFGAVLAGWLQGSAMPPPLRRSWRRSAPFAALLASAASLSVAFLFLRASWEMDWRLRDPVLGGLALATGWGVYAGLMARPIRRALRAIAAVSPEADATGAAVAAGSAIDGPTPGPTGTEAAEPPNPA